MKAAAPAIAAALLMASTLLQGRQGAGAQELRGAGGTMMRRRRLLLGTALAAVLAGGAAAFSGPPSSLVTVDVAVGQPRPVMGPSQVVPWTLVGGLTAEDFEVFSDGKPCPVGSFSTSGASLSLVVLVDVSASTEITVDWLLQPLQSGLVPALKPGDRVAFGRFGGVGLHVDRRFSSRPDELTQAARAALTWPAGEEASAPPPPQQRPLHAPSDP